MLSSLQSPVYHVIQLNVQDKQIKIEHIYIYLCYIKVSTHVLEKTLEQNNKMHVKYNCILNHNSI